MTITTIDPNLFNVPNPYSTTTQGTNTNGYNDTSVFTAQNAQQQQQTAAAAPTADANAKDGKDDGKIGFWEAAGKIVGGAVKSVVNTVKDIVTDPKKLLTTVAAVAIGIAFPPAGVAMAVAGGVMGAGKVVGGISNAANAKTDAEAEAAFEDIGAGTLQVGMSVVGAKAGIKAMKNTTGSAMANLEKGASLGKKVGAFGKDTLTGGRGELTKGTAAYKSGGYLGTKALNTVRTNIGDKGLVKGLEKTGTDALNNMKAAKTSRRLAKDVEGDTNKVREQANSAKRDATQELDNFKNKWTQQKNGSDYINKAGEKMDVKSYNEQLKGLTDAKSTAVKNSAEINKAYGNSKTAQSVKNSSQKQIKDLKDALNEAKKGGDEAAIKTATNNLTKAQQNYDLVLTNMKKALETAQKTGKPVNGKTAAQIQAEIYSYTGKTNLASQALGAANDAAKTAGYGSLATASAAPIATNMDSSATIPQQTATTTPAQTGTTTPFQMPELLTYQVDADKINRDAMNTQITAEALTNGSYGSMLNYES